MLKEIIYLLHNRQKKKFIFLFAVMFVSLVLEMLSISLILPALNAILNEEYFLELKSNFLFFETFSNTNFLYFSLFILFFIYIVKTIILLIAQIKIASISSDIGRDTSKRLYESYLRQNYINFINSKSSTIIRNSLNEAQNVFGFIFHFNQFLIEILVMVGIISVLLFLQPFETFILISLFSIVTLIYLKINKSKVKNIGDIRILNDGLRIKNIQYGINLIREIKLYKKINYFLKSFSIANSKSYEALKRLRIIQAIPRLFLEQLLIAFVVILIILLNFKGYTFKELIPVLGLFGAAMLRLLPSSSRIIISFQGIIYNYRSVKELYHQLVEEQNRDEINDNNSNKIFLNDEISISNLSFGYPDAKFEIIKNFNCEIKKNSVTAFVGKSGSGKSTLVNLILGFLKPKKGEIFIDKKELHLNLSSWQNSIGYVSQSINLIDGTILKNVAFGVDEKNIDYDHVKKCLIQVELGEFINNSEKGLDTEVGDKGIKISGGQAQRIVIARALYRNPTLLILDEATNSLDQKTEKSIINTLNKLKKTITVIVVTHKKENMDACDSIINLEVLNESN